MPVARLAGAFADRQVRLGSLSPATPLERSLLDEARFQGDAAARLGLCLLRVLFASAAMTAGLALTVGVLAQRPLMKMLEQRVP